MMAEALVWGTVAKLNYMAPIYQYYCEGMKVVTTPSIENAFAAVVDYFPHRELAIRRLLQRDDAFREMCEELSEARAALAKYGQPYDEAFDTKRAEWHDLIGRLVSEVLNVLIAYDANVRKDRS